ncbi:hypothetical protein ACHAWF_018028 [Thalassiosira exigua]
MMHSTQQSVTNSKVFSRALRRASLMTGGQARMGHSLKSSCSTNSLATFIGIRREHLLRMHWHKRRLSKDLIKTWNHRLAFLYMPFMHSESRLIHDRAVELFQAPGLEVQLGYEKQH